MYAADNGTIEVVKLLLDYAADISIIDTVCIFVDKLYKIRNLYSSFLFMINRKEIWLINMLEYQVSKIYSIRYANI